MRRTLITPEGLVNKKASIWIRWQGETAMSGVKVRIIWGCSEGPTKISAFDGALEEAGIHNLNLLSLSSIIPPKTTVAEVGKIQLEEPVGSIGKVVLSHIEGMGCWLSSGLGWVIASEGGIIVESALAGRSIDCKKEIHDGIERMMENRSWNWKSKPRTRILEVKAQSNSFSSAVVAALFCIEPLVQKV